MPTKHEILQSLMEAYGTSLHDFPKNRFLRNQLTIATRVIPDKRDGNKAYNFNGEEIDMIFKELTRSFSKPMGKHRTYGMKVDRLPTARGMLQNK